MITDIEGTQPAQFILDGLYAWEENIPEGEDPQIYLSGRLERLRLQTRKMEYPDAPDRHKMSLGEFDDLIAAGEAGERTTFPSEHPPQETFADLAEDSVNIQAAVDQITDPKTKAALRLILGSKVRPGRGRK